MNHDELFLHTMNDLRERIKKGKEYDLIRACGLIRHLILDPDSLYNLLNETLKIDVQFKVAIHDTHLEGKPIEWRNPRSTIHNPHEFLSIAKFKNWKVVMIEAYNYNIEELIRIASHKKGGVHSGRPEKKHLALFEFEKQGLQGKYRLDLEALNSICKIVVEALEPLEKVIKERTPADGL
jgi:hypothetical protein